MKLDDLPYEPDCMVDNNTPLTTNEAGQLEVPQAYALNEGKLGWRMILDCEGQLVAIVPALTAEELKKVLNEAYEEHYTDVNK